MKSDFRLAYAILKMTIDSSAPLVTGWNRVKLEKLLIFLTVAYFAQSHRIHT